MKDGNPWTEKLTLPTPEIHSLPNEQANNFLLTFRDKFMYLLQSLNIK